MKQELKKNSLFLGFILIFIGLYSVFGMFLSDNVLEYIFNYQLIMFLIGIYLLLKNKSNFLSGIILIGLSIYLYLDKYFNIYYIEIIIGIIFIFIGVGFIIKYLNDIIIKKELRGD